MIRYYRTLAVMFIIKKKIQPLTPLRNRLLLWYQLSSWSSLSAAMENRNVRCPGEHNKYYY